MTSCKEVMNSLNGINDSTDESILNVFESLIESYEKSVMILENYEGDDLSAFSIFSESFVQEADEDGGDDNKDPYNGGTHFRRNKKDGSQENIIWSILAFLPRILSLIYNEITGKNKENQAKAIEDAIASAQNVPTEEKVSAAAEIAKIVGSALGVIATVTGGVILYKYKTKKGTEKKLCEADIENQKIKLYRDPEKFAKMLNAASEIVKKFKKDNDTNAIEAAHDEALDFLGTWQEFIDNGDSVEYDISDDTKRTKLTNAINTAKTAADNYAKAYKESKIENNLNQIQIKKKDQKGLKDNEKNDATNWNKELTDLAKVFKILAEAQKEYNKMLKTLEYTYKKLPKSSKKTETNNAENSTANTAETPTETYTVLSGDEAPADWTTATDKYFSKGDDGKYVVVDTTNTQYEPNKYYEKTAAPVEKAEGADGSGETAVSEDVPKSEGKGDGASDKVGESADILDMDF